VELVQLEVMVALEEAVEVEEVDIKMEVLKWFKPDWGEIQTQVQALQ
jgi:hypothetical protein